MELQDYLNKEFPNLLLCPPLFYNWNKGIRFELGNLNEPLVKDYIDQIYDRSTKIFDDVFKKEGKILLVFSVGFYLYEKKGETLKNIYSLIYCG